MGTIYIIMWIAWTIALLIVYHKIFEVYYFSLGNGLFKELITAGFIGLIMTALTFYLWWLTAIIIILIGVAAVGKTNSKAPLIIAVVVAIIISIIGFKTNHESDSSDDYAMTYQIDTSTLC